TPPEIAQRELSLAEVIAIAIDNQPQIAARFGDYAAALARINQALSPLLPQVSAAASATRDDSASRVFTATGSTFTGVTTTAITGRIAASQLLWDFGKTWAATNAAKALAESSREDIELQKDLIVLAVKEQY